MSLRPSFRLALSLLIFLNGFLSLRGQQNIFCIRPSAGLSIPTGDYKTQNISAKNGITIALDIDKFWGKFGLGLYSSLNFNGTQFDDHLPAVNSLIESKSSIINRESWKQFLFGLGPIYKSKLSEKLDLELSFKVGFSRFIYPDFREVIQTGNPLNQSFTLFETRNQDVKDKLNLATIPAMRINFKASEKVNISFGVNYISSMGVLHSYKYLDGGFNPGMSEAQLATVLHNAPTNTGVWKCDFKTIGFSLGLGIKLENEKANPKVMGSSDSTQTLSHLIQPQYYVMLSQNSGNYIEARSYLRIELPKNIHVGGRPIGRIMNAQQQEILTLNDLAPNQKSDKHEIDTDGRMSIDIQGFAPGRYVLIVHSEVNPAFYFRFRIKK